MAPYAVVGLQFSGTQLVIFICAKFSASMWQDSGWFGASAETCHVQEKKNKFMYMSSFVLNTFWTSPRLQGFYC